jgi:UTP--glucose-1-phosphate uridylyltransferase
VGLYIITPQILKILAEMKSGKSGEIRLADAFDLALEKKQPIYGRKIEGEWLDTGDKFNFIKATLRLGLKNDEVKDKLQALINELAQK